MLDEGVCAEVKVGSELRAPAALLGAQRSRGSGIVYSVKTKKWMAPSESVENIEPGKLKAATYAEAYLKQADNLNLPPLKWKESRAA
jgi:hypothetical protein